MARFDSFAPAPGRGQYDRSQTREQRLSEQRERLVAATARVLASEPAATVSRVIELAGVGRGTFYEYFDDVEHARRAAVTSTVRRLEQRMRSAEDRARTPVERFRALASAWCDFAALDPAGLLVALREESEAPHTLSKAGTVFEAALGHVLEALRASRMAPAGRDPLRVTAAAAVAEALGRGVARAGTGPDAVGPEERARTERVLVDVLVLLLR